MGAAGRAVSGGSCEVSALRVLLLLQSLPFLQVFITGFAEKQQLLVVLPFGRGPAHPGRLVLAVENRPEVFKLALDVVDCGRTTEASQTPMK